LVTWAAAAGQATNAGFTLKDGSTPVQTITVAQTQKPIGPVYAAGPFQTAVPFQVLATIHVASGTLNVVLSDLANGGVVADAIRVTAVQPVDLNWVGGGVSGPTVLSPGQPFTIERDYGVTGQAPTANFTIAYYASTKPTPGGGSDFLLGSETISAAADKTVGNHDGYSPTLVLPATPGTYYIYATIDAGGSVLENDTTNDVAMVRGRTPTYSGELYGGTQIIHGPQSFYAWYHDVPGTNLTTFFPLVLTPDPTVSGQFDFNSSAFFPIDGKLYGNDNKAYPDHNYNFMAEFHGSFTYRGGEQITLSSDDDSWIFINNTLALDNGGLHSQQGGTANIDQLNQPNSQTGWKGLGLVVGQTYPIDIFYAERQTNAAALQVQTNVQLTPEAPYTYQVQAVDSDGGAISYALLKGPLGMSINPQTGLVYWQPSRDQVGTYSVTVEALDANGATDTQTYTLTVSIASGPPTVKFASTPPTVVNPGDTYTYKPTVNAPAGDPLTFTLVSGPNISPTDQMTIDSQTGALTWTPQPGDYGQAFLVTIQVNDNQGGKDVQQFNLQVNDTANGQPKFNSTAITTASVGQLYAYQATATDTDNDPLTYDLPNYPAGMVINPNNGQIYWVPTPNEAGSQNVIVRVQDGRGGVDIQSFTIAVASADTPPIITSWPSGTPQVGYQYEYAVLAQDAEHDPLTYSYSPAVSGMAFDAQRHNVLAWKPTVAGPVTVTVTVGDGRGGTASQTFTLTAVAPQTDQPPKITSTPRNTIAVGQSYYYQVMATDPDGDHLTYTLDTPIGNASLDPNTGFMTWTPTAALLGAHSLQLHVSDGRGGTFTQPFTVTVTSAPNDSPPAITSTPRLTGVVNEMYAYNAIATDPDNDVLVWSLTKAPAGLSVNPATGTLRWIPTTSQIGTFPVELKVADPYGGAATQDFSIIVRGTDTPPVITSTPPTTGGTTSAYSYNVQATDADGDPLTYAITSAYPAGMQFSTTTLNLLQWNSPVAGTYPLEIQVSDGYGGVATQDWTLTVASGPADRPPTITSTPGVADVTGYTYKYTVTATDPDNDTVTFSLAAGAPSWLSFGTGSSSNVLSGTPTATGNYPVTVVANDGKGGEAFQSFTIVVTANQAPTLAAITGTSVTAGATYAYATTASDTDGDSLKYTLSYTVPSSLPANTPGPVIDQQGRITWPTLLAWKNTSWPVTVTVSDAFGASASQSFSIAVQPDVTPPTVNVQLSALQVNVGQKVTITVQAVDDVAIASLGLTVGGQAVALDALGSAVVTMSTAGIVTVIGTATDPSGNVGTSPTEAVTVIDPNVTDVPTVSFLAQAQSQSAYNGISSTTDLPIFNGMAVGPNQSVTSTITLNDPSAVISLTATLGISDTTNSGLSATLTNPAGTTITLFSNLSGANLTNTTFDDSAATPIASGTAPYTGSFKPLQALSGLAGNAAAGTYTLKVTNSSGTNTATLTGWTLSYRKALSAKDSAPVDIIGTATDAQGFASYTLSVAPEGSSNFTTIKTGTTAVNGGVLGHFDPTLLANGFYTLQLTAMNTGGRSTTVTHLVEVEGALKMGDFRQTFTDLTVDVAGIPIQVTRTYDSLDANATGDFGYGWHLDVGDAKLKVDIPSDAGTGWQGYTPYLYNTRVYITLPGGTPQGYTFQPYPQSLDSLGLITYYHPYFIPDANDTLNLSVQDALLSLDTNTGEYYSITPSGLDSYNPADPNYGGYFTETDYDGTAYQVAADTGKLQTITDLNGNTLTFTDAGVTNQYGIGLTYTRDSSDRISIITDPLGYTIQYGYDQYGDLVSVTDQMSNKTTFSYNTAAVLGQAGARPHYLLQVNDPLNRPTAKAVYGPDGRLQYVYDINGKAITTSYSPDQHAEVVTDKLGHVSVFVSDDLGNVVQQTRYLDDGTPATSTWAYNGNRMTSSTDPLGDVTTYGYDTLGDQTSVTQPHVAGANPKDFTTNYVYNDLGEVTETLYPDGSGMIDAYDSQGNQLSESDLSGHVSQSATYGPGGLAQTRSDTQGTTQYAYNDKGQPTTLTDNGVVTTSTYDAAGNVLTTSSGGTDATITYDHAGRSTHEQITGGVTVDYGYDYRKDWTSINVSTIGPIQRHLDADGRVTEWDTPAGTTTYTYDANGQLKSETDAGGAVINYGYDALGRQTSMTNTTTGATTSTTYDLAGRIATETQGGVTTSYTYYPDGRQQTVTVGTQTWSYTYTPTSITVTDPLGHATTTAATPDGLQSRETRADGLATVTTYLGVDDASQNLPTSVTDPENHKRTYQYDASGNLISTTDLAGVASTITYDAAGLHLTGPTGLTLTLATDSSGRQSSITYADGSKVTFAYNGNSPDPQTVTLNSGNVITNGYDASGNLTSRDTTSGEHATFGYTGGAMTSTTDATGTTQYTYDASGNLASVVQPSGAEVDYHYDQYGRLDKVTTRASAGATAYVTSYHYDASGHLDSVTDPLQGVTRYTYDQAGRPQTRTLPDGVVTTYGYDIDDRVTSIVHKKADGTVLASYVYTRAADGEPNRIDREDGSYVLLGYDAALRLTSETYYNAAGQVQQAITYQYDAAGNRSVETDSAGTHNYGYYNDQLTSVSQPGNYYGDRYGHNADGQVNSIYRGGQSLTLGYDSSGHLTSVQGGSAGTVAYTYDANGRRVAASDGLDGSRHYLTAPTAADGLDSPYLVTDGSGNLSAGYVYVGSTPLMRFNSSGQPVYYLEDAMDSVVGLADSIGNAVAKFDYDSFGNIRSSSGSATSPPTGLGGDFRFQGAWLDRATGLYNMRARTYDSQTGLFLGRDPKQPDLYTPEEQNLYTFANNNPRLYADPSGQFELVELQVSISNGQFVEGLHAYAVSEVRKKIMQVLADGAINMAREALLELVPGIKDILNSFTDAPDVIGRKLENLLTEGTYTKFATRPNYIWIWPNIKADGEAGTDGVNPSKFTHLRAFLIDLAEAARPHAGYARPDFVFGPHAPETDKVANGNWLVGDIKSYVRTVTEDYTKSSKYFSKHELQYDAMRHYAQKYDIVPAVLFVAGKRNEDVLTTKARIEAFRLSAFLDLFLPFIFVLRGKITS
jgi:fibro-slime domain-containing protein/RHS repeat-associated protein